MSSVQRRWLALWAALLSAVVCLWFIPASRLVSVLILLVLLGLIAAACYGINRRPEHDTTLRLDNLPEATYRQPVVLVCGDLPQSWPEQSQVLTVTQGCWIRVEEGQDLEQVARQLLWQRPDWGRQLSVMVSVCPQQHADSEALTSRLLALRWQISQLRRETGFAVPLVLSVQVGSAMMSDMLWQAATPSVTLSLQIRDHLRHRYTFFWHHKTRLLLITGDEAAIEQLLPGLQQQQWLEGNRTVLIYGGSLTTEPDKEKYTALRKLRRGRPLDGIIRVIPASFNLTPQISDNDLRGLEKISELLRYSAPVWLWQLCDSPWSQSRRTEQAVGATFPLRAKEDDIIRQLERMLPILRAQGMNQVALNNSHDFLLRLGQRLKDGGIARWAQQLVPWLAVSQQRVPLRGLMFSLPGNKPVDTSEGMASTLSTDIEKYIPESQRHALALPVTWQGIVDDCTRVRGRRVGMAWEQTLAWALMAIIGLWGAGTLLSFAVNRQQIVAVAQQAHALVEHPSVPPNTTCLPQGYLVMNDIHSQKIKTGGDPRALPDYAALRDEVAKLSHPARPDIDWNRIEQLSLSLFRQNGVELQTTVWYTLARTRLSGLAGLNEGLAILQMLVTRQWGIMWPQPVHARMEILAGFSQRLQAMLRTFSLGYVDLPQVYQAERHLNAVLEVLARLELKNASQMSELYTFMHNASIRLENTDANRDDITAAVLPASSLNAVSQPSSEPFDALVYVIENESAGQSVIHHSPASVTARPWKGFAAGMLTMFLICVAGGWGWQQLNPTISGPVPVEPTESALTELKLLSPLWRQHYGFALAARAKPDDSARLKAQWQDYIVGNALAPQSLTGWHQGMEGLQTLMQRLNALDERKGKYLTGSELKSMVFTIMQDFGRTVPVEEQLYLLSQEKNGAPLPAALLLQTDTHFNQLLNRYALIQQPSETP